MNNSSNIGTVDQSPRFRIGYRPELDGMRAFAVLAVICFHAWLPFASGGFIGVDVFFVLSGFLITALLCEEWEKHGTISLRNFYLKRILRLLPALIVFLSVFNLFAILFSHDKGPEFLRASLYAVFYMANWVVAFDVAHMYAYLHTWSLSIEEQFYLLWPFLLFVMLRLRVSRAGMIAIVVLGIIGSITLRAVLWSQHAPYYRIYAGLDTRGDGLLIGCLIGLLASWNWLPSGAWGRRLARTGMIIGIIVLTAFVVSLDIDVRYMYYIPFSITTIASGLILTGLLVAPIAPLTTVLRHPALVWTGRLSYGLYLWHYPIFNIGQNYFPSQKYGLLALVPLAILTLGAATISYYFIERPFLRLKSRIGKGKTSTTDTTPVTLAAQSEQ